jgi:hypothetical protein
VSDRSWCFLFFSTDANKAVTAQQGFQKLSQMPQGIAFGIERPQPQPVDCGGLLVAAVMCLCRLLAQQLTATLENFVGNR